MSTTLLFSLRTLFSTDIGAHLLERGTGATYLSENDLTNLDVPVGLARENRRAFLKYKRAIAREQINSIKEIEHQIQKQYCINTLTI